jgi:hypothetical protein
MDNATVRRVLMMLLLDEFQELQRAPGCAGMRLQIMTAPAKKARQFNECDARRRHPYCPLTRQGLRHVPLQEQLNAGYPIARAQDRA